MQHHPHKPPNNRSFTVKSCVQRSRAAPTPHPHHLQCNRDQHRQHQHEGDHLPVLPMMIGMTGGLVAPSPVHPNPRPTCMHKLAMNTHWGSWKHQHAARMHSFSAQWRYEGGGARMLCRACITMVLDIAHVILCMGIKTITIITQENAAKPEGLPPSQGGKYVGFGSTPAPAPQRAGAVDNVTTMLSKTVLDVTNVAGWPFWGVYPVGTALNTASFTLFFTHFGGKTKQKQPPSSPPPPPQQALRCVRQAVRFRMGVWWRM